MKLHSPDIIQVPQKCEETSPELVVPDLQNAQPACNTALSLAAVLRTLYWRSLGLAHLYLVVVPTRDKEGLRLVEMYSTDRPIVLIESIYEGSHSVIPQLRWHEQSIQRLQCRATVEKAAGAQSRNAFGKVWQRADPQTCAGMQSSAPIGYCKSLLGSTYLNHPTV